jgi:hypothetical protein
VLVSPNLLGFRFRQVGQPIKLVCEDLPTSRNVHKQGGALDWNIGFRCEELTFGCVCSALFGGLHGLSSIKRRSTFVIEALNRSTRNSSICRGFESANPKYFSKNSRSYSIHLLHILRGSWAEQGDPEGVAFEYEVLEWMPLGFVAFGPRSASGLACHGFGLDFLSPLLDSASSSAWVTNVLIASDRDGRLGWCRRQASMRLSQSTGAISWSLLTALASFATIRLRSRITIDRFP